MSRIILVPHDGYEMSDSALKYSIEIARGLNMNIKLIRVLEQVLDISTMSHWNNIERARLKRDVEKYRAQIREKDYEELEKLVSLSNSKGVEASSLVLEGNAAEKINSVINKERPYLVVVGSRRLPSRGLSKLKILGSVARKITEESKCPVLVVR
ncbi:MAG TPA: universal stress protein [Nitrososphaera sp.]|jgi:nucleotide-binding universal stress UspA family protein